MQPIEFVLDGSDGEAVGIEYNRVTLERDGEEKIRNVLKLYN